METFKKQRRMRELVSAIREADTAYFKYDEELMTDREYDALVSELQELEKETGIVLASSPTQSVPGEILDGLKKVRHTKPMLSADKTKSVEDLIRFAKGQTVVLSWKLDGLTLVLRYSGGVFRQAVTRGSDGVIGEDVTHTVLRFLNVPLTVPSKETFEVRGEGVISWENFKEINSGMEQPYRHPRGVASGSVRRLDAEDPVTGLLEFFAFELIPEMDRSGDKKRHLIFLAENGFAVVPHMVLPKGASEKIIREAVSVFSPDLYGYPVDGLIMEYADIRYGKSLGATGHHENRLIALKWKDEMVETEFTGLEPAVTRSGMISLTGMFKPVEIDGTEVSRAYLHNLDILENLKLGIGDRIRVYKANMIIPQIGENLTKSGTLVLPVHCPCCGSDLKVQTTEGGTRQLYCENPSCAAKLVRKFVHFCDKTRMDIAGLSEKTLAKFIGKGWIRNFADLYRLERYQDEIVKTEGFGEKSYARLKDSVEKSRHCKLNQFIAGMGIPMVGRHAGRTISDYFEGDFTAFEKALKEGFDFTALPDFGATMQDNLYAWYTDEEQEKLWRPLLSELTFIKEEKKMEMNRILEGKTIVATGKLKNYTRDGIQSKIVSLGAKAGSSVTKKTDYLIVGEKAGSKLAKAKQLGVTILTEEEFEEMIAS